MINNTFQPNYINGAAVTEYVRATKDHAPRGKMEDVGKGRVIGDHIMVVLGRKNKFVS